MIHVTTAWSISREVARSSANEILRKKGIEKVIENKMRKAQGKERGSNEVCMESCTL